MCWHVLRARCIENRASNTRMTKMPVHRPVNYRRALFGNERPDQGDASEDRKVTLLFRRSSLCRKASIKRSPVKSGWKPGNNTTSQSSLEAPGCVPADWFAVPESDLPAHIDWYGIWYRERINNTIVFWVLEKIPRSSPTVSCHLTPGLPAPGVLSIAAGPVPALGVDIDTGSLTTCT